MIFDVEGLILVYSIAVRSSAMCFLIFSSKLIEEDCMEGWRISERIMNGVRFEPWGTPMIIKSYLNKFVIFSYSSCKFLKLDHSQYIVIVLIGH